MYTGERGTTNRPQPKPDIIIIIIFLIKKFYYKQIIVFGWINRLQGDFCI